MVKTINALKKLTLNSEICTASTRAITPNIYKENEAREGYFPWHSVIFKLHGDTSKYICGGTLISSNTVLTAAAHCLRVDNYETIIVKLGVLKNILTEIHTKF